MQREDIQKQLDIREVKDTDLNDLGRLINLPGYRYGTMRLPFTRMDFIRERYGKAQSNALQIVADLNDMVVGEAGMFRFDGRRTHVAVIGMGVHDDFVGNGIGNRLLAALIDTADNWWDLKRLELAVYTDNEAAVGLYKKHGFSEEGVKRQDVFRDGQYADTLMMARICQPR
jgi:putative acetyltransferase